MDIQTNVREVLSNMNMKKVAEEAGISYTTLKNFRSCRKAFLTEEELAVTIESIIKLTTIGNKNNNKGGR